MPSEILESTRQLIKYLNALTPTTDCESDLALLLTAPDLDLSCTLDDESSLLHLAVSKGNQSAVEALIRAGHSWNVVNASGQSVGDLAKLGGFDDLYEFLVQEGARTELLLSIMGLSGSKHTDQEMPHEGPSNAEYLSSKLTYSEGKLVDDQSNGVMMGWETPLMKVHASIIAPTPGLNILNVGFGLGIIDEEIQKRNPKSHTIIEAHPDVYQKMLEDGWDKKEGVKIIFGRWQDVLDQLQVYDGIFFDTFGEFYDDLKEFHDHVPNILSEKGVYSYFNGLAGTNTYFHDVAVRVAECDLEEMGISSNYIVLDMESLGDDVWKGIKRAYWSLPTYKAPICRLDVF